MTQDETEHGRTDERPEDRPMPGDGTRDSDPDGHPEGDADADAESATAGDGSADTDSGDDPPPGPDAEPVYNDRDKLDFDPDDGLYTGTAVTGDTEIPGEHERVDDVPIEEDGDDAKSSDEPDDSSA